MKNLREIFLGTFDDDGDIYEENYQELLDFIQQEIDRAVEEERNRVLNVFNSEESMLDEGFYYNQDVDITEVPRGVILELSGFKKGWSAAKSELLALIKIK